MSITKGNRLNDRAGLSPLLEACAYFEVFAEAYDLKLRDQAQAFSRLHIRVNEVGKKASFLPFAAAFLAVLRYHDHLAYENWRTKSDSQTVQDRKFLD